MTLLGFFRKKSLISPVGLSGDFSAGPLPGSAAAKNIHRKPKKGELTFLNEGIRYCGCNTAGRNMPLLCIALAG
ncbi:MAG: hypothetical protein PHO56_00545 [Patescibacteria group bacterium]|nr:hypothetical protein [Patescibacteria group bacterium]